MSATNDSENHISNMTTTTAINEAMPNPTVIAAAAATTTSIDSNDDFEDDIHTLSTPPTSTPCSSCCCERFSTFCSSIVHGCGLDSQSGGGLLLTLLLANTWRGVGIVGAPHHYSVWASMLALALSLVAIGMPLLVLEWGLGWTFRTGIIGVWQLPQWQRRRQHTVVPWTTGLGVASLFGLGGVVGSYSVAILAWMLHALVDSFTTSTNPNNGPWNWNQWAVHQTATASTTLTTTTTTTAEEAVQWINHAVEYFVNDIVGQSTLLVNDNNNDNNSSLSPTRIVVQNALYAAILWTVVAAVAACGIKWVGRIHIVLSTVSLVCLVALWGASLTTTTTITVVETPTASTSSTTTEDGDDFFMTGDEFTAAVHDGDVLSQSMIQTLHITGILIGILPSLASWNYKIPSSSSSSSSSSSTIENNNNNNKEPSRQPTKALVSVIVVTFYAVITFITGYCLDHCLTAAAGRSIYVGPLQTLESLSTTLLVVVVQWPAALALNHPGSSGGMAWARLVYCCWILLGIQLPIAIVSSMGTVLRDDRASSTPRWKIVGFASLAGFAVSLLFCTDAGLVFLDTIDYYFSLSLLLVGIWESFAAGWIYDLEDQISCFGIRPIVFYILWNFSPVIVAASVWFGFDREDSENIHRLWLGLFAGIVVFLLFFAFTFLFIRASYEDYLARMQAAARHGNSNERFMDPRCYYMEFCFGNVESLKRSLESSLGPLPQIWYIFIKRVVPHLLLLLFIKHLLLLQVDGPTIGFGDYGGYPMHPYQIAGIVLFVLVMALFLLGILIPQVYAPLIPPPTSVFINRRDTLEDMEDTAGGSYESSAIEELPEMEEPVVFDDEHDVEEQESLPEAPSTFENHSNSRIGKDTDEQVLIT